MLKVFRFPTAGLNLGTVPSLYTRIMRGGGGGQGKREVGDEGAGGGGEGAGGGRRGNGRRERGGGRRERGEKERGKKEGEFAQVKRAPLREGRRETRGREGLGKGREGELEAYPLSIPSIIAKCAVNCKPNHRCNTMK